MKYLLSIFLFSGIFYSSAQTGFDEYIRSAVFKLQNNDAEGCIKDFSKAISMRKQVTDPYKIASAYVSRGLVRMQLEQDDAALKDFITAQEIVPEYSRAFYSEGLLWKHKKNYPKVIATSKKCLNLNPTNIEYAEMYCFGHESLLNFERALTFIDSFMTVNNESISGLNIKARNLSMLKKFEESKIVYTHMLEIDPKNVEVWFNRAINKGELKDFKGAEEDNLYAATIDTNYIWVAYNNIAFFVKTAQEDWAGAVEYYNKALKHKPNNAYPISNRGWAKFKLQDIKGAKADLKLSLSIDPANAYAYKYLAQISIYTGDLKEACRYLAKADELNYTKLYDNEVKDLIEKHCK